ncbi:MAG: DUF4434 domain-containing protein [Bacillota bacterium]
MPSVYSIVCLCLMLAGGVGRAASSEAAITEPPRQCQPVISGVLWWLNPAAERSKLIAILDAMEQVGMDTLWLLNTTGLAADPDDTFLEKIYAEADRRHWRVIIETSSVGDWYHHWDIPALKEADRRHVENVARRYSRHRSFYGWYINYEIYMEWGEKSDKIRELYRSIGQLTRQATPGTKLTISPFFLADQRQIRGNFRYATPEEYGRWWKETIQLAGIDIVMLQDSGAEHSECVDPVTRQAFFSAMERACKANGAQLWGNVEMVEYRAKSWDDYARKLAQYQAAKTEYPWSFDMDRNAWKLDLASRYSTRIVSWGWEFWNPIVPQEKVGNSRENYAAYRRYYQDTIRTPKRP